MMIITPLLRALDMASSITDGRAAERTGLPNVARRSLLQVRNILLDNISNYVNLPRRSDVLTVMTAALTMILGESSEESWPQDGLKAPVTSLLAFLAYVSDTLAHNEKAQELRTQQSELIAMLNNLKDHIQEVKVAKQPGDDLIILNSIAETDFSEIWLSHCLMQFTLNGNYGSIVLYNHDHPSDRYKVLHNLAGISAFILAGANIYFIASDLLPSIGSISTARPIPSQAPSIVNADTTTTDSPTVTHVGTAAAVPLRLVCDLLTSTCKAFESNAKIFIMQILNALHNEIADKKELRQPAKPNKIPNNMLALVKMLDMGEECERRVKDLDKEFNDHEDSLNKTALHELATRNDTNIQQRIAQQFRQLVLTRRFTAERSTNEDLRSEIDTLKATHRQMSVLMDLISGTFDRLGAHNIPEALITLDALKQAITETQDDNLKPMLDNIIKYLRQMHPDFLPAFSTRSPRRSPRQQPPFLVSPNSRDLEQGLTPTGASPRRTRPTRPPALDVHGLTEYVPTPTTASSVPRARTSDLDKRATPTNSLQPPV